MACALKQYKYGATLWESVSPTSPPFIEILFERALYAQSIFSLFTTLTCSFFSRWAFYIFVNSCLLCCIASHLNTSKFLRISMSTFIIDLNVYFKISATLIIALCLWREIWNSINEVADCNMMFFCAVCFRCNDILETVNFDSRDCGICDLC